MKYPKKNYAQEVRDNPFFSDPYANTETINDQTGGKVKVTYYSDGSSTYHFGGPIGSVDFNKFGEQQ